jgi:glucose/arabinose dehydrogenase
MDLASVMSPKQFVEALALSAIVLLCAAPGSAQLHLDQYVSGLALPVGFVQDPTTPSLQYVVEQGGVIRVIQNGVLLPTPFLNISSSISAGGERGLLGLAFPPDYASSRNFFVYYTNPAGNPVVARFKRNMMNPLVADPAHFDLRWGGPGGQRFISHPFGNHNGGHLAFGPDGFLYIASGDGGSGNDPQNHGQNPNSLLGKLLRIDVDVPDTNPEGYVVPPDNPFVDNNPIAALPEIWAFGLRNPWKFSFDSPALGGIGAMFIADVGQNNWEEIDYQPPGVGGRNYGWRIREGLHPTPGIPATTPAYLPLVDPIFEYSHAVGASITGGFVYRGTAMHPAYRGRYFYADFVLGKLFSIGTASGVGGEVTATTPLEHTAEVGGSGVTGLISAFGQDAFGEIYVVNYSAGVIFKLVDGGIPPPLAVVSLRADTASPVQTATPVTWTALANLGSSPYTYKFFLYDGSTWTVGQDWSPSNIWTWTALHGGSYFVQVWVRNAGSLADYDAWLGAGPLVVNGPKPLTVTSLTANQGFPIPAGSPVNWTASASGGIGPYSYKFWLYDGSTWKLGRDWGASTSFAWSSPSQGTYFLQVWARNAGSSAEYDAWRGAGPFDVTAPAPLSATSLTADRVFPLAAGTPVTWSGLASGGSGPYTYKFFVFNGSSWSIGQDWSPFSTWTWVPPSSGSYFFQMWVRNAGSANPFDAWVGAGPAAIGASQPLSVTSLLMSPMVPVMVGAPTTIAAVAAGGLGPYTYKFFVHDGSGWSVGQDWSAASTFSWIPPTTGSYSFQVWVRNAGSATAFDAWRGLGPIPPF